MKHGNHDANQPQPDEPAEEYARDPRMSDIDAPSKRDTAPRSSGFNQFLFLLVLLLGAAGILLLLANRDWGDLGEEAAGLHHPGTGRKLDSLHLDPLVGTDEPVDLDDVLGQVVLINYWGTWCPPCRIEFPHLVKLNDRFQERDDFRFLSVSCFPSLGGDTQRLASETQAFLERRDATFPVYSDMEGQSRWALLRSTGMESFAFPTTVVLDRQGTIRGLWIGYGSGYERGMQRLIENLLDEPDLAASFRPGIPGSSASS